MSDDCGLSSEQWPGAWRELDGDLRAGRGSLALVEAGASGVDGIVDALSTVVDHVVSVGQRLTLHQQMPMLSDMLDVPSGSVRFGYQRAKTERRPAVGFLVLLMQRLASSSTAAVLSALERRHAAIVTEGTQLRLFPEGAEEWGDLTGEEQVDALQGALGAAWGNELVEVELLISLARQATSAGLDAKARHLLTVIDGLASGVVKVTRRSRSSYSRCSRRRRTCSSTCSREPGSRRSPSTAPWGSTNGQLSSRVP